MANKNEAEEQNAIDKLNSNLGSASEKIAQNKKYIYWVVGAIAVVAAFVLSYLFIYRNPHVNKAWEAYNAVEANNVASDSVAAAEYAKVADKYSSTAAGDIAALSAAEAYYSAGKYDQAVKQLDNFSTSEPVLEANAMVLKGDCYVNLKKYDQALEAYKKAIAKADKNPQIVPRVLLKEANIYDAQKKYDKALDCYQEIDSNYPEFMQNTGNIKAYIEREKARLGK